MNFTYKYEIQVCDIDGETVMSMDVADEQTALELYSGMTVGAGGTIFVNEYVYKNDRYLQTNVIMLKK